MASGGYREGSGRAKTGYYKGIYCGSTYELAWVIYQLDHNIEFSRFDGCVEDNGVRYFPDFLQNGVIIEIKGYESKEKVDKKTAIANKNGYEVIVLRKEDLVKEFDWVSSMYGKDFVSLYDGYKPKYEYNCSCCGISFGKDRKTKFQKVYCSRQCSLKANRTSTGNNQYTKILDSSIG